MKRYTFLKEYFKNPKVVGAPAPSSRFLAQAIVKHIPARARCIVELGAGYGAVTRAILKKVPRETRILAFETNTEFAAELSRIRDPRLIVIEGRAESLPHYLKTHNIAHIDAVISSLPLTALKQDSAEQIIRDAKAALVTGGIFTQYAVYPRDLAKLKRYFSSIKLRYVIMNIPPTFLFICKKITLVRNSHALLSLMFAIKKDILLPME